MEPKKKKPIGLIIGLAVGIPLSILFTLGMILLLIAVLSPDYETENEGRKEGVELAEPVEDKTEDTWAIYWYLCGSDLESKDRLATDNIRDAFKAADLSLYPEKVTFVIEAGGSKKWHNGNFSSECLTRMVAHGGDYEIVERLPAANMGEADTLADFLTFCNENYPADHTMVLFWDHGGGTLGGVCYDELYDMDSLQIDEMYEAFAKSSNLSFDNPPYDIVGFDSCLMSTLDVANVLSDVAHYMVASEETELGCGWNYYSWAGELADKPKMSPVELGRIICKSYIELCNEYEPQNNATLALLDLSKVNEVVNAYDTVGLNAIKLTNLDTVFYTDFAKTAGNTKGFGNEAYLVDLGDFAERIEDRVPEAARLGEALQEMVIYNATGERAGNATGLSFCCAFFGDETELGRFMQLGAGSSFKYFYSMGMMDEIPDEGLEYLAENGINETEIPTVTTLSSFGIDDIPISFDQSRELHYVDIGPEALEYVTEVKYGMYYVDEANDRFLFLGYDDEIECDFEQGRFYNDISGSWGSIDGIPVFMNLVYAGRSYNEYSVAIDVDGCDAILKVYYDFDDAEWIIGDAYYVDEGYITARNTLELKEGEEIGVVCYMSSLSGDDDYESYILDTFTYSSDTVFTSMPLKDGEYALMFEMSDALNNTIYSDFLYFVIKDGVPRYNL